MTRGNARVAVLTGGSSGIGRATATLFAERGYRVASLDVVEPSEALKHTWGQTKAAAAAGSAAWQQHNGVQSTRA